ncbi:MAG: glucose 1-dehydrogenase [Paludibacteraceae bacterium]|nr:glucose 1-dehydrogenase [Paludibacteraceae bacterium]
MKQALLENKVCIITGAAQGIGKAIAHQFAQDGAIVYAFDRQEFATENPHIHPMVVDITDASGVKAALMQIFKTEGHIDCLVNNAGIVYNRKMGMIIREETERMFMVNVIAVLELIQLTSRLMARNGGGSIVNISSVTAVLGSPGQVAYSATKGAILSLTKSAAKELASQGIRVNAVAPGIVETERFEELYQSDGSKIDERISRIALGRLGTPQDIAHACAFLASSRAEYISGQILGVDGCASI